MEKKVLKACALGLCATTVFIGGANNIVNAQEIKKGNTAYNTTAQSSVTDKKVVNIKTNFGDDGKAFVVAVNKDEKVVWKKELKLELCDEYEYWGFKGELGDKYYYLNYNGKLYAVDIQTGSEVWSTKCDYQVTSNIKYIEVGDKLLEIEGQINHRIVVYDLKTGKILKSVKNIEEKYINKYENNGWDYYLSFECFGNDSANYIHYLNGVVYMNATGKYHSNLSDEDFMDTETAYLKIDVKNYGIEFIKSRFDKKGENITDKKVVSVTSDVNLMETINGKNKNGEVVWSTPIYRRGVVNSKFITFGVAGANDESYYLYRSDGHLYAINMQTGEKKWALDTDSYITSMMEVGNKLVVISHDEIFTKVTIYDKETGEVSKVFENVRRAIDIENIDSFVIYTKGMYEKSGVVYIPVDDNDLNRIGYIKISNNLGRIQFKRIDKISDNIPEKKVVDVNVNVLADYRMIDGVNDEGMIVWSIPCEKPKEGLSFGVADANYKYFYANYNGKIYALDMQNGKKVWSVDTDVRGAVGTEVVGDRLVIVDYVDNGRVIVYDTKTGKKLKAVKNIKSYVPTEYGDIAVFAESMKVENGVVHVEVDNLTPWKNGNGSSADIMIGYLKIDVKNYKIKFVSDVVNYTGVFYW